MPPTRLMHIVGCTPDYIASGRSYFTAETHIRHLDEVHTGARIRVETQVIEGAGKKMHLFHTMYEGERMLATGEHMLIHVSLDTRRASEPTPAVADPLAKLAAAHADLPRPDGARGRRGQTRMRGPYHRRRVRHRLCHGRKRLRRRAMTFG